MCQVVLREGRGKGGTLQLVEVQSCACPVLWTPALHWHLLLGCSTWESCRWGKCWIKAKWLIYLREAKCQGCSVLPHGDGQLSRARGSGAPPALPLPQPTRQRAGEPCLLPIPRRFISRANQLGSINWNCWDKFIYKTTWFSDRALWICPVFLLLPNIDNSCFFSQVHLLPFIFVRAFLERECTTDYIAFKELWSDQHDCCQMRGIKMETIKRPFKNIFSSYILEPRPQEDFWVMPLFSVCLG